MRSQIIASRTRYQHPTPGQEGSGSLGVGGRDDRAANAFLFGGSDDHGSGAIDPTRFDFEGGFTDDGVVVETVGDQFIGAEQHAQRDR